MADSVFWFPAIWELILGSAIVLALLGCLPLLFGRAGYYPKHWNACSNLADILMAVGLIVGGAGLIKGYWWGLPTSLISLGASVYSSMTNIGSYGNLGGAVDDAAAPVGGGYGGYGMGVRGPKHLGDWLGTLFWASVWPLSVAALGCAIYLAKRGTAAPVY